MNCPVCKRDLAPTLSICLTCGAMMNDTVREELQTKTAAGNDSGRLSTPSNASKISRPLTVNVPMAKQPAPDVKKAAPAPAPTVTKAAPSPAPSKTVTSDLGVKKTSPTLVGFHSKNPTVPDWRLQLQNSVRQRTTGAPQPALPDARGVQAGQKQATNGANALKIEAAPEPAPAIHANPRVAKALKRIEESRKAFLETDSQNNSAADAKPIGNAPRTFPFNVVSRTPHSTQQPAAAAPTATKPRLISSLRIEKRGLDTNKLPPIPQPARVATSLDTDDIVDIHETASDDRSREHQKFEFHPEPVEAAEPIVEETDAFDNPEVEEADDLAPFSMRFGAGLFDVIIGGFATSILLSPLMLTGGTWLSVSGVLAFAAALAIVLFVYLTLTVGYYGRTFGMSLFSLEMIDAEENAYPTLHQAAVSASVYLLSMAMGGIGFIPVLFNEERRAAHDLLSGTILIREV